MMNYLSAELLAIVLLRRSEVVGYWTNKKKLLVKHCSTIDVQ